MAEQILDGADVDPAFQEVGCKGMAQGVACGGFGKACLVGGFLELALHGGFVNVKSGESLAFRVCAKGG